MEPKDFAQKFVDGKLSKQDAIRLASWLSLAKENGEEFRREVHFQEQNKKKSSDAIRFMERLRREWAYQRMRRYVRISVVASVSIAALLALVLIFQHSRSFRGADDALQAAMTYDKIWNADTKKSIQLPDGTSVTLNTGSCLRLVSAFNENTREVVLDGEAFFDVAKDSLRPFIIRCGECSFIVRGTSFNISSSQEESLAVVTLHTGALEAHYKKEVRNLNPGDELRIDISRQQMSLQPIKDKNESIDWMRHGRILFDDTPIKQVAKNLSIKFGVPIYVDASIENIPYTGQSDKESITDILHILEVTAPVPIEITCKNDEYYLSPII